LSSGKTIFTDCTRNLPFFAFFRSASEILEVVQPAACFLLESFVVEVCYERRLTHISKEELVAMER
jgi:hypothetical protein